MIRRALPPLAALLLLAGLLAALGACTPRLAPPGPGPTDPRLELDGLTGERAAATLVADDGLALPLRAWLPERDGGADQSGEAGPKAVVLALHGFNDHSGAFESVAPRLAEQDIAVYAYDQRGFGAGSNLGLWAGSARMAEDAREALALLAERYPGTPLYLLGESMGGAVALLAASSVVPEVRPEGTPDTPAEPAVRPGPTLRRTPLPDSLHGVILAAPAVWSSRLQPWYQRWALWLTVRLVPGLRPSGRGNDMQASDNIEALRALGRDPLVIKYSRIDTVQGLVELMGRSLQAAPGVGAPVLLLYGEHDELIPKRPVKTLWKALPERAESHLLVYPDGWHMLLRDLQAQVVIDDVAAWVAHPGLTPPSLLSGRARGSFPE